MYRIPWLPLDKLFNGRFWASWAILVHSRAHTALSRSMTASEGRRHKSRAGYALHARYGQLRDATRPYHAFRAKPPLYDRPYKLVVLHVWVSVLFTSRNRRLPRICAALTGLHIYYRLAVPEPSRCVKGFLRVGGQV